jgi:hypothetical protein
MAAVDVIELSVHQGLQPPGTSAETLIAVCGDPQSDAVRPRLGRLLHAISDEHEDVIASRACGGVLRSFDLIVASGQHPISAVAQEATAMTPRLSFHDVSYRCLAKHKKNREGFLIGLMRFFYQEQKLIEWCGQRMPLLGDERFNGSAVDTHSASNADMRQVEPVSLLLHLSLHVALLPLTLVSEALYVLEQIRIANDLAGQYVLESIEAKSRNTSALAPHNMASAVEIGRACGLVALHFLKVFLRKEYGLTPGKARNASATAALPQRDGESNAYNDMTRNFTAFYDATVCLRQWVATGKGADKALRAELINLLDALQAAMDDHGKDGILADSTDQRAPAGRPHRRRRLAVEETSSDDTSSSDSSGSS